MLTPKQLDTLVALVREERQFWNDEDDAAAARHHGRDDASLNALHDALERLRAITPSDLINAADILERAAPHWRSIDLCIEGAYHDIAARLRATQPDRPTVANVPTTRP